MSVRSAPTRLPVRARRIGLAFVGLFAVLGVVAFAAAQSVPWGPPGTSRYDTYEVANRLVGLPWLLCVATLALQLRPPPRLGMAIAFVGASMIALGSIAEFWVLTETSYRDPLRGTAWVLFLLGHPVFLIGILVAWRQGR